MARELAQSIWRIGTSAPRLQAALAAVLAVSLCLNSTDLQARGNELPLKKTEIRQAARLARTALVRQQKLPAHARSRVVKVESISRGKSGSQGVRKAIVQIYDYDNNQLLTTTVDLGNRKVSQAVINRGKQPPLASEERRQAVHIALADPTTMRTLSRVYERVTGRPLTDPANQLKLRPRNFHTTYAENDEGPDAGDCRRQRCVQLSVVTTDSIRINVVPVINLSNAAVVTLLRTGRSEDMTRQAITNARERRKNRARAEQSETDQQTQPQQQQ